MGIVGRLWEGSRISKNVKITLYDRVIMPTKMYHSVTYKKEKGRLSR